MKVKCRQLRERKVHSLSILLYFSLNVLFQALLDRRSFGARASLYYYGIAHDGEHPELLYRTSWEKKPWVAPTGRVARPFYGTPLNRIWDTVGPKIDNLVNAAVTKSYTINTTRFFTVPDGESVKNGTLGSVVVWISVHPGSTSASTAHLVSQGILQLLTDNGVTDVDVE